MLRAAVEARLKEEVFQPLLKEEGWKVLVLDEQATHVLDACLKMTDLTNYKITLVEKLDKNREPVALAAVYIINPTEQSIALLNKDYSNFVDPLYTCAHVFFTKGCSEGLLKQFSRSPCFAYLRTLKEIDFDFVTVEPHVFHLDAKREATLYWQHLSASRENDLRKMADRLVTVCSVLKINPSLRYFAKSRYCQEFASYFYFSLDSMVRRDPKTLSTGNEKSVILLLDRSFDPISPIVHELTLQAAVYDVLTVYDKGVYKFSSKDGPDKEVMLNEEHKDWMELRHTHMKNVLEELEKKRGRIYQAQQNLTVGDKGQPSTPSQLRQLQVVIKSLPQIKKDELFYKSINHMATDCMKLFGEYLSTLCEVEQDLLMQVDKNEEDLKDLVARLHDGLKNEKTKPKDRLRLLLLFIIIKGGVSQNDLPALLQLAKIPEQSVNTIRNLEYLNVTVIRSSDPKNPVCTSPFMAKQRASLRNQTNTFTVSRWIPYIQDLMEACVKGELSSSDFPEFDNSKAGGSISMTGNGSAHYYSNPALNMGDEASPPANSKRNGAPFSTSPFSQHQRPKLIVFILGGVTYSEMRSAALVMQKTQERTGARATNKPWEIIIGGTHIITPEVFLKDLESLSSDVR